MLQLQIKSCRDVDLDNRLQACYLGDFLLDGKTTHLDQRLLAKVQQVRRPRPATAPAPAIATPPRVSPPSRLLLRSRAPC